ncbi:hypothetical protein MNBD_ALPHA03-1501 [hydrothermal vent metagenome]|uniref:Uncharacterized protein n=1 Tax=hydrothermal vent metagenome TaxID=652676 RepID=A0A3B1AUI3_9ZZZZ
MDMNVIGLHIHELRNQCRFIEASVDILNQSMEKQASVGVFFGLQNIMLGANNISRTLWTPRKKGKERAASLRKTLDLPEKYPLNNDSILSLVDHADEANDQWINQSKDHYILYDFIGDISKSQHKNVELKNIFRAFDTSTRIYTYLGTSFNLEALLKALADVNNRVNQVHMRLYPDQWKEEPAPKEKTDAKPTPKKTSKQANPKKTAVKKTAVKKTTKKAAAKK